VAVIRKVLGASVVDLLTLLCREAAVAGVALMTVSMQVVRAATANPVGALRSE
jgi:hypothetical protein